MRFVSLPESATPPSGWVVRAVRCADTVASLATEKERNSFIDSNAIWSTLKNWLLEWGQNCWYCETKLARVPGDVDHFRPKRMVTVHRKRHASHGGYWWLTYDWRNYRISCQNCNRLMKDPSGETRGKGNEFPIRDEALRATSSDVSIVSEEPLLLDPCVEVDSQLLIHMMDGSVAPAASPGTWEYDRANYTSRQLYLDDPGIAERKREYRQNVDLLLKASAPRELLEPYLRERLLPNQEYSAFLRAVVATHRDIDWIDGLLRGMSTAGSS